MINQRVCKQVGVCHNRLSIHSPDPLTTLCVVEIGKPSNVAVVTVSADASSMQKPRDGVSFVILTPTIRMILNTRVVS